MQVLERECVMFPDNVLQRVTMCCVELHTYFKMLFSDDYVLTIVSFSAILSLSTKSVSLRCLFPQECLHDGIFRQSCV